MRYFLPLVAALVASFFVATCHAGEKVPPASALPQQAQASELAVPETPAAKPVAVLAVTLCNQVVGVVATDAEGALHPLNIEGWSDSQLKAVLASFGQKLAMDVGCPKEPDKQPIF